MQTVNLSSVHDLIQLFLFLSQVLGLLEINLLSLLQLYRTNTGISKAAFGICSNADSESCCFYYYNSLAYIIYIAPGFLISSSI